MESFFDKDSYTLDDMLLLIKNEVKEDLHLDYKDGHALSKDDQKITEITKDVSSFANADGGIIIYGISEDKKSQKPIRTSPIIDKTITKEWLEQKIDLITPRIKNVRIFPIDDFENGIIYVVKIPRSEDVPHMAKNKLYYKRHNFSCEPLEHYEVKDLFYRTSSPKLTLLGCEFSTLINPSTLKENYFFKVFVENKGKAVAKLYKVNAYFYFPIDAESVQYGAPQGEKNHLTNMDKNCVRLSCRSREEIYQNECVSLGSCYIEVPDKEKDTFISNLIIRIVLFTENTRTEMLYIANTNEHVFDEKQIEGILKNRFPNYHMDWL